MRRILFTVFGFPVYGYGTMLALGVLVAVLLSEWRAKKKGIDQDKFFNMAIIAVICGILGGKLFFIITNFSDFIASKSIAEAIGDGFVVYGSIIGGVAGVFGYCKKAHWNMLEMFDIAVPGLALAQGIGRIGCLFAGCCYGKETTLPIGIKFTDSYIAPNNVLLFPTQICSSIFDILLAMLLLWLSKKNMKDGRLFSVYLMIYSVGRFIIEFFRSDPRGNVGALSSSQFISIFVIVLAIIIYNIDNLKPGLSGGKQK